VKAKRLIKEGIHKYWSRNASQSPKRKIVVGGVDHEVTTQAIDDSSRGVRYIVDHGIFSDRACNFGVIVPGGAIDFTLPPPGSVRDPDEDQRETGAHEFGHSVLKDGWGYSYSLHHKGTSTAAQNPVGPDYPPPPAEIDLMTYFSKGGTWAPAPSDIYVREVAAEEDVKALIATVRLELTSK
jgi:hypothetical protein